MTIEEGGRKRRAQERADKRAERLGQRDVERRAGTKADDANVQSMIERSIKDHGA